MAAFKELKAKFKSFFQNVWYTGFSLQWNKHWLDDDNALSLIWRNVQFVIMLFPSLFL